MQDQTEDVDAEDRGRVRSWFGYRGDVCRFGREEVELRQGAEDEWEEGAAMILSIILFYVSRTAHRRTRKQKYVLHIKHGRKFTIYHDIDAA